MKSTNHIVSKTIVFITGAFVASNCWDEWKKFFEAKGYDCLVIPWPNKDAPAKVLRSRQPSEAIASMRLQRLTDYYASQINFLPEKPILIGHSMGGLITQLLLQRNLAAAGVAIHSVAPQGVICFSLAMLRSVWGPLGYFSSTKKSFLMSFSQWQFAFTNGMPEAEQKATYDKFCIPESKMISRDGLTKVAKIDFTRPHAPLLITAGSTDHIVPAKLNYATYKKYRSQGITSFKEFEGRNHLVLAQPTWHEDAQYIYEWLNK
ncbi:alpha/beta hydrolase [Mucilaginibacter terrenus]|uniref:Alpha/beta hydrolase n=1 Tax=Mucilaginibacter terrenus TaxID=2482727 RepID=A0A3E2NVW1_9SPHI|nr:alpha/beta hydrolase [Mucilaginibacter terrenus]RFZ85154.1 alpha/beta hydrolase [Mucilaginibacter terrenus]